MRYSATVIVSDEDTNEPLEEIRALGALAEARWTADPRGISQPSRGIYFVLVSAAILDLARRGKEFITNEGGVRIRLVIDGSTGQVPVRD